MLVSCDEIGPSESSSNSWVSGVFCSWFESSGDFSGVSCGWVRADLALSAIFFPELTTLDKNPADPRTPDFFPIPMVVMRVSISDFVESWCRRSLTAVEKFSWEMMSTTWEAVSVFRRR